MCVQLSFIVDWVYSVVAIEIQRRALGIVSTPPPPVTRVRLLTRSFGLTSVNWLNVYRLTSSSRGFEPTTSRCFPSCSTMDRIGDVLMHACRRPAYNASCFTHRCLSTTTARPTHLISVCLWATQTRRVIILSSVATWAACQRAS